MKLGEFEMETMREIWGKNNVIEVGPDRDGLDLVEIRLKEKVDGVYKIMARMTLTVEQAQLVSLALGKCVGEIPKV